MAYDGRGGDRMRNVDYLVEHGLGFLAERICMEYSCDMCSYGGDCPESADCAEGVEEWLLAERAEDVDGKHGVR